MSDRVAKLEDHRVQSAFQDETQSVNEPSRPQDDGEPAVQSTPWADVDPNEKPDFSFIPSWDEEEEDDQRTTGVRLFKTSEKTEAFLKQSFTTAAPNQQCRQWREKIGAPNTPFTALSINGQAPEVSSVCQCKDSGQDPGKAPGSHVGRCGSDHPHLRESCQRPAHPKDSCGGSTDCP